MFLCSKYYPLGIGLIKPRNDQEPDMVGEFDEKPKELKGEWHAHIGVFVIESDFITSKNVRKSDETLEIKSIPRAVRKETPFGYYMVQEWSHVHGLQEYYDIQRKYYPLDLHP